MAKHTFPASTFEDEHGQADSPTAYPDDMPDIESQDPEYDDVFQDGDTDDGGSQEWRIASEFRPAPPRGR